MNQYQNITQEKTYEELQKLTQEANETVTRMKQSGIANAVIYDVLIKKGIPHSIAVQSIDGAIPGGTIAKSEGKKDMIIGACWIAGGLIITIGSYMAVSESGGMYFAFYGPIIYGVIRFFKGVSKM